MGSLFTLSDEKVFVWFAEIFDGVWPPLGVALLALGPGRRTLDLSGEGLLPTASSLISTAGLNQVNPTTMPDCFELPFVLCFLFGPMVGF